MTLIQMMTRLALFLIIRPLFGLISRNPKQWAFYAGHGFQGNPKYLMLWLGQNRPDIRAVWLAKTQADMDTLTRHGVPAVGRSSLAGYLAMARSGVHIFDGAANPSAFGLGKGALQVNLWHGSGIKNLEFEIKTGPRAGKYGDMLKSRLIKATELHLATPPDAIIASSDFQAERLSRCFRLPKSRAPILGTPRLDISLFDNLSKVSSRFADYSFMDQLKGRDVLVYMPTFRDTNRPILTNAFPDLKRLDAALEARGAVLYIKLHPNTKEKIDDSFYTSIRTWPAGVDIYQVLARFKCLITDYSSILYDYIALHDSGVVIYDFDYADYTAKDRDFATDYESNIIGARAKNFEQFIGLIETGDCFGSLDSERLSRLRTRFWDGPLAPASPRIVTWIEGTV